MTLVELMKLLSKLAILLLSISLIPCALKAADASGVTAEIATEFEAAALESSGDESHAHGEHHGLPPAAVEIFNIGPLKITNSMVVTSSLWPITRQRGLYLFLTCGFSSTRVLETHCIMR